MFGETIDMIESLQVTVLGMAVVFSVLVLLMVIIKVTEKAMYKGSAKKTEPAAEASPAKAVIDDSPRDDGSAGSDTELVAVIAAAVASSMGVSPSNLVIRNIVRVTETAPIWSLSGRADLMASRSIKQS